MLGYRAEQRNCPLAPLVLALSRLGPTRLGYCTHSAHRPREALFSAAALLAVAGAVGGSSATAARRSLQRLLDEP